jgi:tRNA U34 2-thiouridine synthase MnmA/TrmU
MFYTIGQRKVHIGGLSTSADLPWYVVGKILLTMR